ncbi:ABC transporter ATP-binding protein [Hondaea fermentalgiana]|uniref:ABC transporter ATP-binding protein n=1 Tax=Hondaea fermentalgiana TaxID=2315210 RepID=A0A2R5GDN8_9STRA|nr:ABC transporter ATP-binding protein [Hondaea fermentalgiana]|eukprot:GBG28685.1 ABC transporter ATP-binding protein [Hondaea fermentalgiana]
MKRRRPLETLMEIFSPMLFVLVVVAFFNISKIKQHESTIYAAQTYDVAKIAEILRDITVDFPDTDNELISVFDRVDAVLTEEGMRNLLTFDEFVWIHLALRNTIGADLLDTASDLLSRVGGGHWWNLFRLGRVIISPDTPETLAFRQWMNDTYRYWHLVEGEVFDSLQEAGSFRDSLKEEEREETANGESSSSGTEAVSSARVWAHLHFDELNFEDNRFEVRIRMQHSVLPDTEETIREFSRSVGMDSNRYQWSGFLSLQRAVELFVANRTHVIHTDTEFEAFAGQMLSAAMASANLDDPRMGYTAKYLVGALSSSNALSAISHEAFFDFVEDISGLNTLMENMTVSASDISGTVMKLPSPPYAYSLADDWSAPFPTLGWEVSEFYERFGYITGLIMACAVVYPVSQLILVIVQEKEIRMKEMMKIMGLREWVFHASWLITYTVFFFIQALAQAAYISSTVFAKADFSLVLVFIFLFNMTLISLAFIISTFFNRAKLASMLGPLVVFCMVVPAYIFTFYETYQFVPVKKALSLLAPTAYALGLDRIIAYERNSIGLTWRNMHDGNMPFSFTLGMLVFDFFLYCFIAWYLDKVLPTKYGTHEKASFILRPSYWSSTCSAWAKRLSGARRSGSNDVTKEDGSIEKQLERVSTWDPKQPSVEIKNLTKIYGGVKRKVAVRGINLEIMHGEVTCLLGTNGAGKSTTIAMLSGLYDITSGDSYIYGDSIVRDISSVRKIMGVCPQHNVLYPDLTVREHLEFFAALKGVKTDYIDREVYNMVNDCELADKVDVQTRKLSGGQKRKLSLAISLIGDSKVVFLDEPSAGMDVQSRRSMMGLLLRHKRDRTIILTTHHLEEADLLGDRVAIMKDGSIACVGSPLELKLKYGLGYVMVMTKKDHANKNVDRLCAFVKKMVPSAKLLTNSAGEVSFQLPSSENKALIELFSQIEPRLAEFNINSYGIAMTSLEDVFLSVAEQSESESTPKKDLLDAAAVDPTGTPKHASEDSVAQFSRGQTLSSNREWDVEAGEVSYRAQLWQVIRKRIIALRRDRGSIFHEIFMPLIVVTSVLFILSIKPQGAGPPLELSASEMLKDFNFKTKINHANTDASWLITDLDPTSAKLPEAFNFARVDESDPESSMTSEYFSGYLSLFDHDCDTSICLSWRNLLEQQEMAKQKRFSDIDVRNRMLEMCSYRIGDSAFLPMNLGDIAGFSERDQVLDEVLDLVRDSINGTDLNMTIANLTIEDLREILNDEGDRYFRARACAANVTLANIRDAFGIDNFTETFGIAVNLTDYEDENVLCRAVQEGNVNFTMAVLYLEDFGFSENIDLDLTEVLKDYIPSSLSFSSIFSGDISLGGLNLGDLLDSASLFEDGFVWVRIPSIEGRTMREILGLLGLDLGFEVEGDTGLLSNWISGFSFGGVASNLTIGTLVGSELLNVTIPIPMSSLFTSASGHAKAVCLKEMAEARLRTKTRNPNASFKVWNHPFETIMKENVKRVVWLAFFAVLFTLVPFCYNPACYGMHAVQERVSHAKHLLFVSGLGYKTYWLGNLIFDFACYMIVALWTLFCFAASGAIDFADSTSAVAYGTSCLFLAYGLAAIPQAYCLSFLFSDDSTAQIVISLFNFITGWMFTVTAVSLDIYGLYEVGASVRKIFRWFPAFNLGEGLIAATEESITRTILEDETQWDVFAWEFVGRNLVILCLLSLFYFGLLVLIEWLMGNVRVSKSLGKMMRGVTKYRTKRQNKSSIMPMHVADRADDLREEVANNEPVYQFSDDEDEEEGSSKASSIEGQSSSGIKLDQLYAGVQSSVAPESSGALEQYDLDNIGQDEIMEDAASQKVTKGGVLRRMDQAGAEGFEFEPHERKGGKKQRRTRYIFDEDEDVRSERHRVFQSGAGDILQLRLLRKVFANVLTGKKHVAVRQLSLGIKPGECFGFLGTNGAGKTTTMKMITRESFPSEGKILLRGKSIFHYSSSRDIGYCPQFDALFPRLTATEHLQIYANIKGVPAQHIDSVVEHLLDACDLRPFAHVISSTYSGGTKRKLSIALALIGKPDVILLDEPSAGVDPAARRRIWEIICSSMSESRSIVLTSHSMEECEALCDRVSIMAGGVMRCIGPSLHLKKRFCSGYEVQIRANSLQDCVRASGYIQTYMKATIKEQYGPQATLSIPFEGMSLSLIFKTLEKNRESWGLSSYGVSQASLEQVFMNIASKYNIPQRVQVERSSRTLQGGSSSRMFGLFR